MTDTTASQSATLAEPPTKSTTEKSDAPKRSEKSGVLEGSIEKTTEGFVVKHEDGSTSSYTMHGPNEEVPGSVDDIGKEKRPKSEQQPSSS